MQDETSSKPKGHGCQWVVGGFRWALLNNFPFVKVVLLKITSQPPWKQSLRSCREVNEMKPRQWRKHAIYFHQSCDMGLPPSGVEQKTPCVLLFFLFCSRLNLTAGERWVLPKKGFGPFHMANSFLLHPSPNGFSEPTKGFKQLDMHLASFHTHRRFSAQVSVSIFAARAAGGSEARALFR